MTVDTADTIVPKAQRYAILVRCDNAVANEVSKFANRHEGVEIGQVADGVTMVGNNMDHLWELAQSFFVLYTAKKPCETIDMCFSPVNGTLEKVEPTGPPAMPAEDGIVLGNVQYLERHPSASVYSEILISSDCLKPITQKINAVQSANTRILCHTDRIVIWTLNAADACRVERTIRNLIEANSLIPEEFSSHPLISYEKIGLNIRAQLSERSKHEYDMVNSSLKQSTTSLSVALRGLEDPKSLNAHKSLDANPGDQLKSVAQSTSDRTEEDVSRCSSGRDNKPKKKKGGRKRKGPQATTVSPSPSTSPSAPVAGLLSYTNPTFVNRHVSDTIPAVNVPTTPLYRARDGSLQIEGNLHGGHPVIVTLDEWNDEDEKEAALTTNATKSPLPNAIIPQVTKVIPESPPTNAVPRKDRKKQKQTMKRSLDESNGKGSVDECVQSPKALKKDLAKKTDEPISPQADPGGPVLPFTLTEIVGTKTPNRKLVKNSMFGDAPTK